MSIYYWQIFFPTLKKMPRIESLANPLQSGGIKNIFITNANEITMMNPHFHMWDLGEGGRAP